MSHRAPLMFRGVRRDGTAAGGSTCTRQPAELCETLLRNGWRRLTVTRDGIAVGGIYRHPVTRRRTWWAAV